MGDSRIKDVSALLSAFFDEEKLRQGGQYAQLFRGWKRIAGERLAAHTRVSDIDKGILVIEAEHPGWIQLLQLRQAQMLEEARAQFPELGIRGISFRLGAGAGGEGAGGPGAGGSRPGPFGPGGREPAGGPEAAPADKGGGTHPGGPSSLEDIGDPKLRSLLGELKKTVDGGK